MSSPKDLLEYLKNVRNEVLAKTHRLFITFPLRIPDDAVEEVVAEIRALGAGQIKAPRLALVVEKLLDTFAADMRQTVKKHVSEGGPAPGFSLGSLDRDLLVTFVMWLIKHDIQLIQSGDALSLLSFLEYNASEHDATHASEDGP